MEENYKAIRFTVKNESAYSKDAQLFSAKDKQKKDIFVDIEQGHEDFLLSENRENRVCFMARIEKYSLSTATKKFSANRIVLEKKSGSDDNVFLFSDYNDFKEQEFIVDIPMNEISFKEFPLLSLNIAPNSIYEVTLFTKTKI